MTRRSTIATAVAFVALAVPAIAFAAEPSASPLGGDPRSAGEGPGLVGDPLFAIGVVLAIAVASVIATTIWLRLAARRDVETK